MDVMKNDCDCEAVTVPIHYVVSEDGQCECGRFGVVSIDDVPVGTGRLHERGQIADVEWSKDALRRIGLAVENVEP